MIDQYTMRHCPVSLDTWTFIVTTEHVHDLILNLAKKQQPKNPTKQTDKTD